MSKRKLMFTDAQRRRLFFNNGCGGCLAQILFLPIEIILTLVLGVIEAVLKPSKHPFRRRRLF